VGPGTPDRYPLSQKSGAIDRPGGEFHLDRGEKPSSELPQDERVFAGGGSDWRMFVEEQPLHRQQMRSAKKKTPPPRGAKRF